MKDMEALSTPFSFLCSPNVAKSSLSSFAKFGQTNNHNNHPKGFHSSFPNTNGHGGAITSIGFNSNNNNDNPSQDNGAFDTKRRTRFVVSGC